MKHDNHRYVQQITETLKESRSYICTYKTLRTHKLYTYAKATLRAKDVFVRTIHLERTRRTCTQNLLNAQKTYLYAQAA